MKAKNLCPNSPFILLILQIPNCQNITTLESRVVNQGCYNKRPCLFQKDNYGFRVEVVLDKRKIKARETDQERVAVALVRGENRQSAWDWGREEESESQEG